MGISITKMSKNGQVVIPAEIRKDGKIETNAKFLVYNEEGIIVLKPIKIDEKTKEIKFEKIKTENSEEKPEEESQEIESSPEEGKKKKKTSEEKKPYEIDIDELLG